MVAIKDFGIPSCCGKCKFGQRFNPDEDICRIDGHIIKSTFATITQNRDEKCPLIGIEERKVGKWIIKDNGSGGKYVECPFCGALAPCTEFADRTVWKYSKFCYDCGNELRGAENG